MHTLHRHTLVVVMVVVMVVMMAVTTLAGGVRDPRREPCIQVGPHGRHRHLHLHSKRAQGVPSRAAWPTHVSRHDTCEQHTTLRSGRTTALPKRLQLLTG
jgi:hypothetical protein